MPARIPHFDLPFRLSGGSFATVEQDTYEDVFNAAQAILRTDRGTRDELPEFGRPPVVFVNQPIGADMLEHVLSDQDARIASIIIEQHDAYDYLIDRIKVEVFPAGGQQT